jgi:hypothetical protein
MSPKIEALIKATGCADVGELLDRMLGLGKVLYQFKQEHGRPMTAIEMKYLEAVLHAKPQERT